MEIREAEIEDRQRIVEVCKSAIHSSCSSDYSSSEIEELLEILNPEDEIQDNGNETVSQLVAIEDEDIAGFIMSIEVPALNECLIEYLFVDPEKQGNGIGSKLVKEVESSRDFASVFAESTKTARKFFQNIGYEVEEVAQESPRLLRVSKDL
jgi:N-acetylglutamate synthase-like GNAT family acetyltransferase